ncbi:putative membrane-associated protein [Rubellimicrobium thermophilum DSM 16684]|uniref:Putative membrane-associated protein n=1 Tax=Rubellimicrobium thermophilum DSM 16684 TaxID=1123069 RepID=S9R3P6_9RHOB|nr:DedA family protein [Rubellimicrobium thermophilum]EPX86588.1 putative membrane-associated protein [Rubellimicrobium thermophilum DSM 16684]
MFDLITGWIQTGGLAMVGLLMVLENVFPPIPSELIVPLAGYEAAQGSFSLIALLIVATLGSLLGTLIWYGLARAWGHDRFLRFVDRWGPWLTLSPEEADRAMDWFARHGRAAVFFGRLVPTVRTLISVPAGLSGMNPLAFLLFTAAGSFLWIVILAGAGYLLRENYDRVEQWLNPLSTLVVILILGTYLYRLVTGLWRRGRR